MRSKPIKSLNLARLRVAATLGVVAAGLTLAGCGGGGTTGATVAGKAIDGYLQGATVCLDLNRNSACDAAEPQSITDAGGNYSFTIPDGYDNAGYEFLVDVPPTAVDSDNPNALVGRSFVLRTSFYQRSVITPLTTVLTAYAARGLSASQAAADLGLPANFDFSRDYVAAADVRAHNVAKVVARILQTQTVATPAQLVAAVSTHQTAIQAAAASATPYSAADLTSAIGAIVPEAPTTPAPAPSAATALSIYSNAYTAVSGVNTNPGWGQATRLRELQVASGDSLLQLSNINYQGLTFDVLNVSTMNTLHVDIWSASGGTVTLGLVTSGAQTGGDPLQTDVPIALSPGWNAINIPLSSFARPDLSKVDQMVWAASGSPTIYVDNLYFWNDPSQVVPSNTSTPPGLFEDFESATPPTLGDFGQGGITRVVEDPTNSSNKVAEFTKVAGGPSWNGMFWTLATPLNFQGSTATVTTRVWVDRATTTPNELFLETDAGQSSQVTATSAGPWAANTWQTITWTFTGLNSNATYTKMGFAPNRGGQTSVNETYYLDNISLITQVEKFDAATPPTLGDFGQGGITRVVEDPTNSSNKVAEFTKVAGGPSWNGMFWTLATPLNFQGSTATVTTRVWVDRATTTPNELFLETDAGQSSQVTATSAGPWAANTWQTITWTFTGLNSNATYTKMGFAPNRGGQTSVNETYYLDDIVVADVNP